jgi:hypothetical protein
MSRAAGTGSIHNPDALTHTELEVVRRDIANIDVRLEWLDRYVKEHADLTAKRAELAKKSA